jgi:hypothetical protein
MPVILPAEEEEIKRITVQTLPGENSSRDRISKQPITIKELMEWFKW